jgi:predicted phosphoadenosine phosphosulfate sulfurtransferase
MKIYNDKNVFDASMERIEFAFDNFENLCVSYSGGKDSTVMIQLVEMVAKKKNKKYDVLFIDMEAQYLMTIEHIKTLKNKLQYIRDFYWVCLPLSLRNAVSVFEPRWICWEKAKKEKWVREMPDFAINEDNNIFPFFRYAMEFEEFVPEFEKWYSEKYNHSLCCHFVGIRCDESLNRFRTIVSMKKDRFKDKPWTTRDKPLENTYSIYPIYDWRTEDDWIATFKYNLEYNYVYELMYKNGLSIHMQRLCQPFGDDQKNGLDQYKAIEAENWDRLIKRVAGVNFGNIYCRTSALGNITSQKPDHMTWQEWALYLLESIGIYNKKLEKHYAIKIRKFFQYWEEKCGCTLDMIEDEADKKMESLKIVPSWRRVARALERNDFFLTRLSFGETKSDVQYLKEMIYGCNNLYDENSTDSKPLKRLYNKVKEEMENEKNEEIR